jgi:hypothetical protein
MANSVNPPLEKEAASVQPSADVEIRLICGDTGYIFAAEGIDFSRYKKVTPGKGQIIMASSKSGSIEVHKLGDDETHETELILGTGTPDQLHIRIPAGVSFNKHPATKPGYPIAFRYHTDIEEHNVLPLYFPLGHEKGQAAKELAVVETPVPPRANAPIKAEDTEPLSAAD